MSVKGANAYCSVQYVTGKRVPLYHLYSYIEPLVIMAQPKHHHVVSSFNIGTHSMNKLILVRE